MRRLILPALALLAQAAAAHPDEIVLKDGRRIEWRVIRDLGDSYEIETPQGKKTTVTKADFERLVPRAGGSALTGAAVVFDKAVRLTAVDLLRTVDPKRDAVSGSLRIQNGALVVGGTANVHGRTVFRQAPPEEFDLTMVVERKEGTEDLGVGFIGGGRRFMYVLDERGKWSGPCLLDGATAMSNGQGSEGTLLKPGVPHTVTLMVRKDALIVRVDDRDRWSWRPGWERLSVHAVHDPGATDVFFVECYQSSFQISRILLTSPKP